MTAAPRVVVIGAGLSGLTAAYRLLQGGVDVFVLEARDRVGGRAWRIPVGSAWFDAGCELLDAEHHALLRLASELGVETAGGRPWVEEPGSDLDGAELDLYHELEAEIAALAGLLDPEHPEQLEGAAELDRETIAGWLAGRGASSRVLEAAETWIAVVSSSVPTTEMSRFAYAAKIAAGAAPTGLSLRFVGGPTAIAGRLADELGGRVRLGSPVVGLEDGGNEVSVRLADGGTDRAMLAVVAVPLTLQRELRFDPPLPEYRSRAIVEARYGEVLKEAALFDEPPRVSLPAVGAEGIVYSSGEDPRLVVRFAGGAAARAFDFAGHVGEEPRAHRCVDWTREAWSRGSYLILGPGHLTTWGHRLGEPHGRIRFAGAERSTLKSYMEGAVRGGEAAAEEALAAL